MKFLSIELAIALRTATSESGFFAQLNASQLSGPMPSYPRGVRATFGSAARRFRSVGTDANGSMWMSPRSSPSIRFELSGLMSMMTLSR